MYRDTDQSGQLIYASLSHTHYWYEVGMLKVCMVTHIARVWIKLPILNVVS